MSIRANVSFFGDFLFLFFPQKRLLCSDALGRSVNQWSGVQKAKVSNGHHINSFKVHAVAEN